ncbi:hypothetical protein GCM10027088_53960 [Nocardia goodfellowii]
MTGSDVGANSPIVRVGDRLRQIRQDRGLTLTALSRSCGVSVSYLSAVEKDINQPSLHTLAAITAALGVSIPDVVGHLGQAPARRALLPDQPGTVEIAHARLRLRGSVVTARPDERGTCPVELDDRNLFLYVVSGALAVRVDGTDYRLDMGDALEATGPREVSWHSPAESTVLWTSSPSDDC